MYLQFSKQFSNFHLSLKNEGSFRQRKKALLLVSFPYLIISTERERERERERESNVISKISVMISWGRWPGISRAQTIIDTPAAIDRLSGTRASPGNNLLRRSPPVVTHFRVPPLLLLKAASSTPRNTLATLCVSSARYATTYPESATLSQVRGAINYSRGSCADYAPLWCRVHRRCVAVAVCLLPSVRVCFQGFKARRAEGGEMFVAISAAAAIVQHVRFFFFFFLFYLLPLILVSRERLVFAGGSQSFESKCVKELAI